MFGFRVLGIQRVKVQTLLNYIGEVDSGIGRHKRISNPSGHQDQAFNQCGKAFLKLLMDFIMDRSTFLSFADDLSPQQ